MKNIEKIVQDHSKSKQKMIEKLAKHSVVFICKKNEERVYNCTMYAFNLYKSEDVWKKIEQKNEYLPNKKFTKFCIQKGYLSEKCKQDISDGDYIIYYSDEVEKHIGLMKNGRVESKWGDGYIWEHNESDVTYDYDQVKYYKKIENDNALKYYEEFAAYIEKYLQVRERLLKKVGVTASDEICKNKALIESGILDFKDSEEMYMFIHHLDTDINASHWKGRLDYLCDLKVEDVKEYFDIVKNNGNYNSEKLINEINKKYE